MTPDTKTTVIGTIKDKVNKVRFGQVTKLALKEGIDPATAHHRIIMNLFDQEISEHSTPKDYPLDEL